jgi:hypothetical protein
LEKQPIHYLIPKLHSFQIWPQNHQLYVTVSTSPDPSTQVSVSTYESLSKKSRVKDPPTPAILLIIGPQIHPAERTQEPCGTRVLLQLVVQHAAQHAAQQPRRSVQLPAAATAAAGGPAPGRAGRALEGLPSGPPMPAAALAGGGGPCRC